MKLFTAAAGALLLAAAFTGPVSAAPQAPASETMTGTVTQQSTQVRWHGRHWNRGRHNGWSRGRHMGMHRGHRH